MDARASSPARIALYFYAGLTAAIGVYLILWGPVWFPVPPGQSADAWVPAAMVRIIGGVLVVFSSAGLALTRALDDPALLRGIQMFAIGHLVLWSMLTFQRTSILESSPAAAVATGFAMILFGGLLYVHEAERSRLDRRGDKLGMAVATHSRYDQAIREAASQEERHRLARELHDSIKQQIFAMQTAAATAELRLEESQDGVRDAIALVRSSAREAMTEMEAMLDQLRATPLNNAGLVAALQKQCDALGFRTGATVSFSVGALPADSDVGPGVRPALLRVAQEALANVARHARARHVTMMIGSGRRGLDLSISDDGAGFDLKVASAGMGLRNMQSRAADFDGELTVVSEPGTGTTVRMLLPVGREPASAVDRWKPWNSNSALMMATFLLTSLRPWRTPYLVVAWVALLSWMVARQLMLSGAAKGRRDA